MEATKQRRNSDRGCDRDAGRGSCQRIGMHGVIGILLHGRGQFFHGRGGFFERAGLLLGTGGQIGVALRDFARCHFHLLRRAAHLRHQRAQLGR